MAAIYAYSNQRSAFLSCSYPDFRDLRSLETLVESAAAFVRMPVNLRLPDGTGRVNSEMIAGDYFRTAGVAPALGRPIMASDQLAGAPPVTLISDSLWESRYQRSPAALGSQVWIDDVAFTIVGVMPHGYGGTLMDWYANPSVWIPLTQIRQMLPPFRTLDFENRRDMPWLMILARLRPGVAAGQLEAAANSLGARLPARRDIHLVALPSNRARFFPGHRTATLRILWILMAVSIAALVIACFNLANLLLARTASRQKEIGTRLALGAPRFQLLRQFVIENVVLAGGACALGLPMALGLAGAARAFQNAFGLSLNLDPDARALTITLLAGVMTSVIAGLAPAWRSSRMQFVTMMKSGPAGAGRLSRLDLRDVFVTIQIACAMVALVSAAQVFQSLQKWNGLQLGYSASGIVIGEIDMLSTRAPSAERDRLYRALLADARAENRGAALASQAMPTRTETRIDASADAAGERWMPISSISVSDGYFELLRIPVIQGRGFLARDDAHSRPVVILSQAAARLLWPYQNPIGQRLRIRGEPDGREVVGLVGDVRFRPLGDGEAKEPLVFLPLFQRDVPIATIHALPAGNFNRSIPELRRIVARTLKDVPLSEVQSLDERVQSGLSQVRLVSRATGAVGLVGVVLALVGALAAASYRVAQRKSEIALRVAIGAAPYQVVRTFIVRGLFLGLAGSLLGLVPTLWVSGLLRSSLRGVDAPGAFLLAVSAFALVLAVIMASWIAAGRISSVQPAQVLRMQ